MNERFKEKVSRSGMSQYKLAKAAGVPFATVNGLMTGTHSVNKCSAAMLARLAGVLKTPVEELLDFYHVMEGVQVRIKGYRCEWQLEDGQMTLVIHDKNKAVKKQTGIAMNYPERRRDYDAIGEFCVDDYIEQQEFDAFAQRKEQLKADDI